MTELQCKRCTDCHCSFHTYAIQPYCRKCIKKRCVSSHMPAADGRFECTCTFDLTPHKGTYICLGHFKSLQNFCVTCGVPRPESCHDFQHDHMWYCPAHRMQMKQSTISTLLQTLRKYVCHDVVIEILKHMMTPVKHRYPDSFHIPMQRKFT